MVNRKALNLSVISRTVMQRIAKLRDSENFCEQLLTREISETIQTFKKLKQIDNFRLNCHQRIIDGRLYPDKLIIDIWAKGETDHETLEFDINWKF